MLSLTINIHLPLTGKKTWFVEGAHRDDGLAIDDGECVPHSREEHLLAHLIAECCVMERASSLTDSDAQGGWFA